MLRLFMAVGVFFLLSIGLAELYSIFPVSKDPVVGIGLVNSILCAIILVFLWWRGALKANRLRYPEMGGLIVWMPAVLVVAFALLVTLGSSVMSQSAPSRELSYSPLVTVIWIPFVEEVVFRAGVGPIFRRTLSGLGGLYLSALFFAFAHSLPTIEKIAEGNVGVPIGALMLGFVCELIYVNTGRLMPAVAFHGACNLCGVLYALLDPRWLEWLDFLFL